MNALAALSNQIADVVDTVAASVVQVRGHRAPVSGVVYAKDIVITNALGREDGVVVRAARAPDLERRGGCGLIPRAAKWRVNDPRGR